MAYEIPFNKVYITGDEEKFMHQVIGNKKPGAGGEFTDRCVRFFEEKYSFEKCFLTTSCTSALEMAALLCNVVPGDEIIVPSFTFVSTANAFALRGAKLIFADSASNHPNINADILEGLITPKTKVLVVMHYAGEACDMVKIKAICTKYNILLVEDAAQAIDAYYKHTDGTLQALGTFGDFAAFSFHETKNITCGEGGMLVVNNSNYIERAEIVYQKGTNRSSYLRNERQFYEWVDLGSSFALSELNAAFLWGQLLHLEKIQLRRKKKWNRYFLAFQNLNLPQMHCSSKENFSVQNAHIFYVLCESLKKRQQIVKHLEKNRIQATFHFLPLDKSLFINNLSENNSLNALNFSQTLLRLPLFNEISDNEVDNVLNALLLSF
jgi:dTDP-4-amino-4,6-dideoxygalactose transaminase